MRIHIIGFSTGKGAAGNVDAVSFISSGAVATGVSERHAPVRFEELKIIQRNREHVFTMKNSGKSVLEIFNVAGQKIYENEFSSRLALTCGFFRKGVYFAIVKSGNKILARRRFVVIR